MVLAFQNIIDGLSIVYFKTELQVPLMIKVPGLTKSSQSDSFAELVDLYPTICELLNIKGPKNLQGNSLVENLNDPNKITKTFAYSRYIHGDAYMSDNFSTQNGNTILEIRF